jgi:2-polyprenyl-3-methyl-5-hydroxy-6-metoxy-1,4-benzoquinol methylase
MSSNLPDREFFVELDSFYKNPSHLQYKKMELVLEHVKTGGALIDVGCGTGEFIIRLANRFSALVGTDMSPNAIEFAKRRIQGKNHITLHCGELESLHLSKDKFDVCLCLDVFEHVPNLSSLVQEIHRILRPHGEMLVTVPNWYDIIATKVFRKHHYHLHALTPWKWMDTFRQAGFKIRSYRAVGFPLLNSDFLSRKIPYLGMCIFIVASKE